MDPEGSTWAPMAGATSTGVLGGSFAGTLATSADRFSLPAVSTVVTANQYAVPGVAVASRNETADAEVRL